MNRQFIYGVGLALLGLCVAVVGDAVVNLARSWMLDVSLEPAYGALAYSQRGTMAFASFLVLVGLVMAVVPPIVQFMTADRTLPPVEPAGEPVEDQSEVV